MDCGTKEGWGVVNVDGDVTRRRRGWRFRLSASQRSRLLSGPDARIDISLLSRSEHVWNLDDQITHNVGSCSTYCCKWAQFKEVQYVEFRRVLEAYIQVCQAASCSKLGLP